MLSFNYSSYIVTWTWDYADPANFEIQKSADGVTGWTTVTLFAGSVRSYTVSAGRFLRVVPLDSSGNPLSAPSDVVPQTDVPVLSSNSTISPFTFAQTLPHPSYWQIYKSTDVGATWHFLGQVSYGSAQTITAATGDYISAEMYLRSGVDWGARSNVIRYNSE